MRRPTVRLNMVSFASDEHRDASQEAVRDLGYELCVTHAEEWLLADAETLARPTILVLSRDGYPREKLWSVLLKTSKVLVLRVFTCDEPHWGTNTTRENRGSSYGSAGRTSTGTTLRRRLEDILSNCNDFMGWPCHKNELELRLQRVFSGPNFEANNVEEVALLEQFVNLDMQGNAPVFLEALKLVKKFARCEVPVLIEGETGTGKELAARAIHYLSARRDYPFIPVNCGAIPDSLVENELFGHERGAFTDAKEGQPGLVAQVEGGTLFLDELDALSAKGQVTLLRFLDNQEYKPLGSKGSQKANARIVAATNAKLEELVSKGQFRQDLLFRLNVLSVELPSLRERRDDINLLAKHFIGEYVSRYSQPAKFLHPQTLAWMVRYHWPGNVRQLENLLHREFLLAEGPIIWIPDKTVGADSLSNLTPAENLSCDMSFSKAKASMISAFEKSYLSSLMVETHGNISLAARRAGKERSALRKLLRKHEIRKTV